MNVTVVLEHRFSRTPDGAIWTPTGFAHSFWTRYLDVFDEVRVAARVREAPKVPADWQRADGECVSFAGLPHYLGPQEYLLRFVHVRRAVREAMEAADAVILRTPCTAAALGEPVLRAARHPYAVEVVGDPHDVFAPGAVRHPLRPFFRWWFAHHMRRQCAGACAVAYVTAHALQQRYPTGDGAFATHYSSVELPDSAFVPSARTPRKPTRFALVTVGSLAQLYKAPDVLLDAVAACLRQGLDVSLALIGEGKHRPELEARATALGIADRVNFLGQLPAGEAVRAQLDRADLFVLPSRTEGLPRAMIEAMARALPCIGSTAGGIPELLPLEDMVAPGGAPALAAKIGEVLSDPERMARMSRRNVEKAREYREDILRARRITLYRRVREKTEAWLKHTDRPRRESFTP